MRELGAERLAEHAPDAVVRGCAAEMSANERTQLQRLKRLLAEEIRDEQRLETSAKSDAHA